MPAKNTAESPTDTAPAATLTPAPTESSTPSTPALVIEHESAPPLVTPVTEPPPAEHDKPFLHTDTPTLLNQKAEAPAEVTPGDKPGDKPGEATDEVEPAPAEPIDYDFKLPEGVTLDKDGLSAYTDVLSRHRVTPEAAQEVLDLYTAEVQQFQQAALEHQHRAWADTRKGWVNEVLADPELGGAGHQTAMQRIFRMRDHFVPEKDRDAFDQFLNVTGAGDHPAFLRFLYRVGEVIDEGTPAPVPQKPAGPAPTPKRKLAYDHPRSQNR